MLYQQRQVPSPGQMEKTPRSATPASSPFSSRRSPPSPLIPILYQFRPIDAPIKRGANGLFPFLVVGPRAFSGGPVLKVISRRVAEEVRGGYLDRVQVGCGEKREGRLLSLHTEASQPLLAQP